MPKKKVQVLPEQQLLETFTDEIPAENNGGPKPTIDATKTQKYDASKIQQMGVLDAIRNLTAMYLGGVGLEALFQTYLEAFTNAADEVRAVGVNKGRIVVECDPQKGYWVFEDNGRGIPVGVVVNPETKVESITLRAIYTAYHTGGKFKKGEAYTVSGGMHGTGAKALSAFAKKLTVITNYHGYRFEWTLENGGKKIHPIFAYDGRKKIAAINTPNELKEFWKTHPEKESRQKGTKVIFYPDAGLLNLKPEELVFEIDRFRETVELICAATGIKTVFNGDVIYYKSPKAYLAERYGVDPSEIFEFSLAEHKDGDYLFGGKVLVTRIDQTGEIISVVNNLPVPSGRHINAFTRFLSQSVMDLMTARTRVNVTPSNVLSQGAVALMILEGTGASFGSQAKTELVAPPPSFFNTMLEKSRLTRKADFKKYLTQLYEDILDALNKKALKKSGKSLISTKLADCQGNTVPPENRVLFIVEGDSAGLSCKIGRDPSWQAILPLSGKPDNVYGRPASQILNRESGGSRRNELKELNDLIKSGKFGYYCILSDADPDGKHIGVLLITFFNEYHPELIRSGKVLWLIPPLYGVVLKNGKIVYAKDDAELQQVIKEHKKDYSTIQRYKGLGELNPDQMHEFMVDDFDKYTYILDKDPRTDEILSFFFGKGRKGELDGDSRREFLLNAANQVSSLDEAEAIEEKLNSSKRNRK